MNEDRERTVFAAVVAVFGAIFGAIMFIAGALLSWSAGLFVPWGYGLLVLGALSLAESVLAGFGVIPTPGSGRAKERR
jgi:hypothetical protein